MGNFLIDTEEKGLTAVTGPAPRAIHVGLGPWLQNLPPCKCTDQLDAGDGH